MKTTTIMMLSDEDVRVQLLALHAFINAGNRREDIAVAQRLYERTLAQFETAQRDKAKHDQPPTTPSARGLDK